MLSPDGAPVSPRLLRLQVDNHCAVDGGVDLVWQAMGTGPRFAYATNGRLLQNIDKDLRGEALTALQAACHEPQSAATAAALRSVALAGVELYQTLTDGHAARPQARAQAAAFREWLEAEVLPDAGTAWRIECVLTGLPLLIAWGLIFAPRPGLDIAALGTSFDDYRDFWSCRFSLAASKSFSTDAQPPQLNGQDARVNAIIERRNVVAEGKPAAGPQRGGDRAGRQSVYAFSSQERTYPTEPSPERLEELGKRRVHDTPQTLRQEAFDAHPDHHQIIYVSLNAKPPAFGADELRAVREVLDKDCFTFMIVDHDAVIRGDRGPDWQKLLMDGIWSGLIAVETDITNQSIAMAGFGFLRALLHASAGKSLADSIYEVRRALWPQSLLYGIYCDPRRVRFDSAPDDLEMLEFVLPRKLHLS